MDEMITSLDDLKTLHIIHNMTCGVRLDVKVHANQLCNVLVCEKGHEFVVDPDVCGRWVQRHYSDELIRSGERKANGKLT